MNYSLFSLACQSFSLFNLDKPAHAIHRQTGATLLWALLARKYTAPLRPPLSPAT